MTGRGASATLTGGMHDESEPFGLCWGQQWSWHEQQAPAAQRPPGLINGALLDLPANVGGEDVRAVLRVLLSRHQSLRTSCLPGDDGAPCQRVWPVSEERYELGGFVDAGRCDEWLRRPMDVRSGWPVRAAVVRPDAGPARLGLAVHHLAADRLGFGVLWEELRHVVDAAGRGEAPALPPAGRQPADVAAFERSPAGVAVNERAIAHWLDQDGALGEVLDWLRRTFGEPGDTMHVARVVSASGRRRLGELAEATGGSEASVAVAAVGCVLSRHLGRATFPMTMSVSNRHLPGLARSVCSVAQSGLVRVAVADPSDLAAAVPDAWSGMLAAIQHAYYSGDELSERMRAFDSGGLHVTAAPPNVNVVTAAALDPPRGRAGDEPWTSSVGQVRQRCASLFFHVRLSESHLEIELRAGAHLLPAGDGLALVADAMRLIHR